MSEQNETNETSEEQDIKRWTAQRLAALVIGLLRSQTTVADAAHNHSLKEWLSGANICPHAPV